MGLSLEKGGNLSLTKAADGVLSKVMAGLGWDARTTDGAQFDLDASAFLLGKDGKVYSGNDSFIFYGHKKNTAETVVHHGDNLTGDGDGDDEQISISLDKLADQIEKIVLTVTIYKAEERKQNFGMVSNAYVRIVNSSNNEELARYDLSEDASTETAMIFGELYRHNGEWKFKAVGQGYSGGLEAMTKQYGVVLG